MGTDTVATAVAGSPSLTTRPPPPASRAPTRSPLPLEPWPPPTNAFAIINGTLTVTASGATPFVPAYDVLYPNQPEQFTANTSNAGADGVTWSVNPPGSGSISGTGLYMAPASISSVQAVTITATSVDVPSLAGSSTIYISPQPFVLFTSPLTLALGPGTYNGIIAAILSNSALFCPFKTIAQLNIH